MYTFNADKLAKLYNKRELARIIGVAPQTIQRIFCKKQNCSKIMAYSICKAMHETYEIEDLFLKNN